MVEPDLPALGAGQVRFRIERFAVTANTVTYATTGDLLGYWDFFPTGEPGWGCVPAMGWAQVSNRSIPTCRSAAATTAGIPMARFVDMAVTPTADGLRDDGPHRAAHAPVYRAYVATDRDPFHQAGTDAEDRHALLRGLFITGWLAEDYFADNDWFGARRVLVLSASSKTAIGFAHCADARAGIEVIGVTSGPQPCVHARARLLRRGHHLRRHRHRAGRLTPIGVDRHGGQRPGAGRRARALREQLRHSMAIGRSHHEAPPRSRRLARTETCVLLRADAGEEARAGLGTAWLPGAHRCRVKDSSTGATAGSTCGTRGGAAAAATWQEVHAGRVAPDVGYVVSMWD